MSIIFNLGITWRCVRASLLICRVRFLAWTVIRLLLCLSTRILRWAFCCSYGGIGWRLCWKRGVICGGVGFSLFRGVVCVCF